jgi:hypothetical protein
MSGGKNMISNYRVIQYTKESGEVYFQVQQVMYEDSGKPVNLVDPVTLKATDTETLKNFLIHQLSALTQPALDSKIFTKYNSAQTAVDILKGKQDV